MTNTPTFKSGDKVKTAAGGAGVVVHTNSAGTAALVNSGEGDTFDSSWYAVDSLSKSRGSSSEAAE